MTDPKALPPSSMEPVINALDYAMEGVSDAITYLLDQPGDNHRFKEVSRLATIGQALGRQRARATQRVEDFVPSPAAAARNRYVNGPNYGALGGDEDDADMGAVNLLADEEEGACEPIPNQRFVNRVNRVRNPAWIGAPHGVQGGAAGDDGFAQGLGMFQPMFADIARTNERRAECEERETEASLRLALARELEALGRARGRATTDREQTVIQERIDAVTDQIASGVPEDDPDNVIAADATELLRPPPPPRELRIRCPRCDNVHGRHWITEHGIPRRCDVCNSATILEEVPPPDPAADAAPEAPP